MCGIAGLIDSSRSTEERAAAIGRMCDAMIHRGPDDHGIASSGPATLGMRRLAIFDPANGHQPMQSVDGRFTLVFNGAIYNFRELRGELGDWTFRTECDTEVLLAAYVRWGARCLNRLRGMFAFAIWDAAEQTLFFARDAFGIKPLYFRHEGGRLLLASELNALNAAGIFPAEIDPVAVADYLAWLAVPAPRTIYRQVSSLRPGECGTFRSGKLEIQSSWNFHQIPENAKPCRTRQEFVAELRTRLEDTVRAHTIADVPVGAFLSGGLDSAVVTGLMSRAMNGRLRTFAIDFAEPGFSEATAAEASAKHFNTEHRTTVLTGAQVAGDIETLLQTLDQPTGDGINTYYASQAARGGGVTVALSGLGGDELFGGYPSFRDTPRIARWLPAWRAMPRGMRRAVVHRLGRGDTRRRKIADVLEHASSIHEVGSLQRRVFSEANRSELLHRELVASIEARSPFHPELARMTSELNGSDAFDVVSAWELRTYMADVLLRDSDVMSMRHSLELRVPLVDRPLVEWLWRQPAHLKADPSRPKSALAEAVQDILPPGMADRQKRGFTLPFDIWMKRELRPFLDETFSDASIQRSGFLERAPAQALWRGFVDGRDTREWSRVWSLAILIAFVNRRTTASAASSIPAVLTSSPTRSENAETTPRKHIAVADRRRLLLAPEIFASEGGIPRILQTYLRALGELGPNPAVRLVALNDATINADTIARSGNAPLEAWSACGRRKVKFVREALRLSRGCDDLICGHVFLLPVAWLAARLNPRLRYYLIAHGIEVWRPFRLAERIALRGVTRIFCVSDFTRRELHKHFPIFEDRTAVLYNGLDPSFPIEPGRPLAECSPVILTVTRLTAEDRYKGVEHLIEALPIIRRSVPDVQLRIVGRGNDLSRLQDLARTLGVDTAVTFLGYLPDHELTAELRSCRLFALPSSREGFGLVFLEAMAHGRPCLGAQAGGVPEVITPEAGVLVNAGDIGAMAAHAVTALRRTWDQNAILARARHFSYEHFRSNLEALLAA